MSNMDIKSAAKSGDLEQVKACLERHDSYSLSNLNQALHLAAMSNHPDVVDYLLKCGADVSVRDSSESSLAFGVVLHGFPKCLKLLLYHRIDINVQNNEGDTALHVACMNSQNECLEVLLSQNDININIQNRNGLSPLMVAAKVCFLNGITRLVDKQCAIDATSRSQKTAIIFSLGKDIPLEHDQHRTSNASRKLLCLKSLVQGRANVNVQDRDGFGPLHYAVKTDNLGCVQVLVDCNCDLNQCGFYRKLTQQRSKLCRADKSTPITPFLLSVYYKNMTIAKFLIQSGCIYYKYAYILDNYLDPSDPIYNYLQEEFYKVKSLKKLCIMSIRHSLGQYIDDKIIHLAIPEKIKRNIIKPQNSD